MWNHCLVEAAKPAAFSINIEKLLIQMKKAIIVAIIAGIFSVLGNLITVIGPGGWPWARRLSFSNTNAYIKMSKAYPSLDKTLTKRDGESSPHEVESKRYKVLKELTARCLSMMAQRLKSLW